MNNNSLTHYEFLSLQQENKNFYSSIAIFVITFLSALVVYWDYKHRKKKECAEKSIEIAKDFALNIIKPLSILYVFFKINKIDLITKKIDFLKLEDFDIVELENLYSSEDIKQYKEIFEKEDSEHRMHSLIRNTLNTLEYQCMYISTKVADEKYIYSSLHQQFLSSIALLYFEIALINTDDKDKYYTNIIKVYNLWKNKYIKSIKKELKFKKKQKKIKRKLLAQNPTI